MKPEVRNQGRRDENGEAYADGESHPSIDHPAKRPGPEDDPGQGTGPNHRRFPTSRHHKYGQSHQTEQSPSPGTHPKGSQNDPKQKEKTGDIGARDSDEVGDSRGAQSFDVILGQPGRVADKKSREQRLFWPVPIETVEHARPNGISRHPNRICWTGEPFDLVDPKPSSIGNSGGRSAPIPQLTGNEISLPQDDQVIERQIEQEVGTRPRSGFVSDVQRDGSGESPGIAKLTWGGVGQGDHLESGEWRRQDGFKLGLVADVRDQTA